MSKFKKGDKARVISVDSYDAKEGVKVGDIVTVNQSDSCCPWVILGNGRIYCLTQSQMEHYIEPPKEITLNGATYVLKEERKPEHEWKFGDVVENEGKRYMLIKEYGLEDHVSNGTNARHLKVVDFETKNVKSIPKAHTKFLRRTDFSV